jgi:hypothetical protein
MKKQIRKARHIYRKALCIYHRQVLFLTSLSDFGRACARPFLWAVIGQICHTRTFFVQKIGIGGVFCQIYGAAIGRIGQFNLA